MIGIRILVVAALLMATALPATAGAYTSEALAPGASSLAQEPPRPAPRTTGVLTPAQAQRIRFAITLIQIGEIEDAIEEVEIVRHQVHHYETARTLYYASRELQIGTPATIEMALNRLRDLVR